MKIITGFFYGLAISIEYLYSIPLAALSAIGEKISDLSDAMEGIYNKSKEKQSEKNK